MGGRRRGRISYHGPRIRSFRVVVDSGLVFFLCGCACRLCVGFVYGHFNFVVIFSFRYLVLGILGCFFVVVFPLTPFSMWKTVVCVGYFLCILEDIGVMVDLNDDDDNGLIVIVLLIYLSIHSLPSFI